MDSQSGEDVVKKGSIDQLRVIQFCAVFVVIFEGSHLSVAIIE